MSVFHVKRVVYHIHEKWLYQILRCDFGYLNPLPLCHDGAVAAQFIAVVNFKVGWAQGRNSSSGGSEEKLVHATQWWALASPNNLQQTTSRLNNSNQQVSAPPKFNRTTKTGKVLLLEIKTFCSQDVFYNHCNKIGPQMSKLPKKNNEFKHLYLLLDVWKMCRLQILVI